MREARDRKVEPVPVLFKKTDPSLYLSQQSKLDRIASIIIAIIIAAL